MNCLLMRVARKFDKYQWCHNNLCLYVMNEIQHHNVGEVLINFMFEIIEFGCNIYKIHMLRIYDLSSIFMHFLLQFEVNIGAAFGGPWDRVWSKLVSSAYHIACSEAYAAWVVKRKRWFICTIEYGWTRSFGESWQYALYEAIVRTGHPSVLWPVLLKKAEKGSKSQN